MDINYQSYLKVDDLLELQVPLSEGPEHDELLFITIHQVYELWFKQLLHEFDLLQESLESASFSQSNHTLKRVRAILKTLVGQLDILETMTPYLIRIVSRPPTKGERLSVIPVQKVGVYPRTSVS